ncbi:MAG: carboxymuconolactone decarboxylase family protein [Burkholderiaceae bacterium]
MARLLPPDTDAMNEHQRIVYDAIASGPRKGVRGPLGIWLWRSQLAERAQSLGQYCRYDSSLPARLSELAILVTARHWSSEYEWQAHRKIALEAGLSPQIVESIRVGSKPVIEADDERVVYEFASVLLNTRRVDSQTYRHALAVLGRDSLVDLVGVLGYYGLISMTINAFEVDSNGPAELA